MCVYACLSVCERVRCERQPGLFVCVQDFFTLGASPFPEIRQNTDLSFAFLLSSPSISTQVSQQALRAASEQLISKARSYVADTLDRLSVRECGEFPQLREAVRLEARQWVEQRAAATREQVGRLIEAENWVFTLNPQYLHTVEQLKQRVAERAQQIRGMSASQQLQALHLASGMDAEGGFVERCAHRQSKGASNWQVWEMQMSLFAYSRVLARRQSDVVPMVVWLEMVSDVPRFLARLPAGPRFMDDRLGALMQEDAETAARRTKLSKRRERLAEALDVLATLAF